MKSIQNFGYGTGSNGLRKNSFSAFCQKTYAGGGWTTFFNGGISATNSISFPNSDDQIISIDEIACVQGVHNPNISDFIQITKNDKVIFKIFLWELIKKEVVGKIGTLTLRDGSISFKKLKNPIIVNGTDNIKIQAYLVSSTTHTLYLRGLKYSKTFPMVYNESGGKRIERNDFTLYHQKTVSTGSNIFFASDTNELAYSKLLPLSNRESFVINAIEVLDLTQSLVSDAELVTAEGESTNYANELKIVINNVEILKTNDIGMFSFVHRSSAYDFIQTKYGTYVLKEPVILPAASSIQISFNTAARTKAGTGVVLLLKGELISEVN